MSTSKLIVMSLLTVSAADACLLILAVPAALGWQPVTHFLSGLTIQVGAANVIDRSCGQFILESDIVLIGMLGGIGMPFPISVRWSIVIEPTPCCA